MLSSRGTTSSMTASRQVIARQESVEIGDLHEVAGIPVQQEARLGVVLTQPVSHDSGRQSVGHQVAGFDDGMDL